MKTQTLTGLFSVLLMLTVAAGCGSGGSSRGDAATFSKSYGGSGFDEARAVAPTTDGGYVFAGTTGGASTGFHIDAKSALVMRLDAQGNVMWQRRLPDGQLVASNPPFQPLISS